MDREKGAVPPLDLHVSTGVLHFPTALVRRSGAGTRLVMLTWVSYLDRPKDYGGICPKVSLHRYEGVDS